MRIDRLKEIMKAVASLYDKTVDDSVIELFYYPALCEYDEREVLEAIREHIKESPYFPKPNDILSKLRRLRGENYSWALAYMVLKEAISRVSIYNSVSFVFAKGLNQAVMLLGGWIEVCNSDERFLEKRFREAWEELQSLNMPRVYWLPGVIEIENKSSEIPLYLAGDRFIELRFPREKLTERNFLYSVYRISKSLSLNGTGELKALGGKKHG